LYPWRAPDVRRRVIWQHGFAASAVAERVVERALASSIAGPIVAESEFDSGVVEAVAATALPLSSRTVPVVVVAVESVGDMLLCVVPVAVADCCAAPSTRGRAVELSAISLEAIAVLSVAGSCVNGDGLFFVRRDVALVVVLVLVLVLVLMTMPVLVLVLVSRLFSSIASAGRRAGVEESGVIARSGTWSGLGDCISGGDEGCMSSGEFEEGKKEGSQGKSQQQVKKSRNQERELRNGQQRRCSRPGPA
jgi:hypothetical protein